MTISNHHGTTGTKRSGSVDGLARRLGLAADEPSSCSVADSTLGTQAEELLRSIARERFTACFGAEVAEAGSFSYGFETGENGGGAYLWNRFKVERSVGSGGFGVVFQAFDTMLERQVALKLPKPEHLWSEAHRGRFLREARIAASLNHPGIVKVYEVGEEGPIWYIASEFCDGPSLAEWMRSAQRKITPKQAAELVAQIADAVDHAHQHGVLHRDIKPSNILVRQREGVEGLQVLLTDFGLASRHAEQEEDASVVRGTYDYMAPEALTGRAEALTTRADIYSLGVVLYEVLAGEPPLGRNGESTLESARERSSRPLPALRQRRSDVPQDLEAVCARCLAANVAERYAAVGHVAVELRRFLRGEPVDARPLAAPVRAARWCRREPWLAGSLGVLLVTLVASILAISWFYVRERSAHTLAVQRAATTREVLQDMSGTLADGRLTNVPDMDATRIALLERSVEVYRELARDQPDQEQSLHDLSVALHRLANAYSQTGRIDEGRKLRGECLEIIAKLRTKASKHAGYQYDEFMNLLLLGGEWRGTDVGRASILIGQAYRIIQSLVAEYPDNVVYQDALAAVACEMGADLSSAGRMDEARQVWEEAARHSHELWSAHRDHPLYLKHAVYAKEQLGNLAVVEGDLVPGIKLLKEALKSLEIIRQKVPEERWLRGQLGNLLVKMADASLRQREYDVADQQFHEGLQVWSELARDYPDLTPVREWIATANYRYAVGLVHADRLQKAVPYFRNALEQFEALAQQHTDVQRYREQVIELKYNESLTKALQAASMEDQ